MAPLKHLPPSRHGTIVPANLFLNIDQLSFNRDATGGTRNTGDWLRTGRFRKPFLPGNRAASESVKVRVSALQAPAHRIRLRD